MEITEDGMNALENIRSNPYFSIDRMKAQPRSHHHGDHAHAKTEEDECECGRLDASKYSEAEARAKEVPSQEEAREDVQKLLSGRHSFQIARYRSHR